MTAKMMFEEYDGVDGGGLLELYCCCRAAREEALCRHVRRRFVSRCAQINNSIYATKFILENSKWSGGCNESCETQHILDPKS